MVSKLTKAMSELSQNDDDEIQTHRTSQRGSSGNASFQKLQQQQQAGRRKSARLNSKRDEVEDRAKIEEQIHDSGTESEDEEMLELDRLLDPLAPLRNYDEFLSGASPPALSASPKLPQDGDTESSYSFGHESGIMTGDNDSDVASEGLSTPIPNRRGGMDDDASSMGGEKRRHSMTTNDHPIAWRLRSFNLEPPRTVKVAARRCPVHVLINRPPTDSLSQFHHLLAQQLEQQKKQEAELLLAPATKRNRRNSNRPSLDFDKMVETRITTPSPPPPPSTPQQQYVAPVFQKPVTRSQINQ